MACRSAFQWVSCAARPNPRLWLILVRLDHGSGRLDLGPWAPRHHRAITTATKRDSPLPEPASHIQPGEYQSRPRGREVDAQPLTRLAHAVERQSDPHNDEAGQGQDVHAEQDGSREH
jgi:hypothetical protein